MPSAISIKLTGKKSFDYNIKIIFNGNVYKIKKRFNNTLVDKMSDFLNDVKENKYSQVIFDDYREIIYSENQMHFLLNDDYINFKMSPTVCHAIFSKYIKKN